MLWIGIDVGGTFTDGVVYDDQTRSFAYAKAPSTPGAPTLGVLATLDALGQDLGQVARFCHGVTIGTNAILEKKGAEVWMLVTQGFRDVLEIGRTNRPVLYDLRTLKAAPLVPRSRTLEVAERLMFDGSVRVALDPAQVRDVLTHVPEGTDVAVAVCFLHAYANPAHEQAVKAMVQQAALDRFVCASEEVSPQFREVEQFNTTVLNAYIGPLMARYLDSLREGLAAKGYRRDVFIMTSNGGVATAAQAKRLPVGTVLSGPAGGVAATVHLGRLRGIRNLITCDMGGTSTDVCLIEDLRIPVTNEQRIGDYANRTPQIEIDAVGAGGGSIAWLDDGDILKVGPQSAGADPGPACYGRGGTQPTVTDANLVLNRLAGGGKLAGKIGMDPALAQQAVGALGAKVGLDARTMAEGIIRIAVANMVSAIKQISISNGYDPRDFVLLPYHGPALGQARCRHLVLAEGAGRRRRTRHAGALSARGRTAGHLQAGAAAAEDFPHDERRQAHRRHFRGRDHQHPLHALRGRCAGWPGLGRKRRRPPGPDRPQPGKSGSHCRVGRGQPLGELPGGRPGHPVLNLHLPLHHRPLVRGA